MPQYDYIIVGGGSAGSVMAHRLSARSANKVLLCEAGQDTPPGNEPPEIADSYSRTAYFDPRQVMTDDEALEAFVRKAAIGVWHASCSCRMGRPDDPMSVVDTQGRGKGVQSLRVVDASVFPVVLRANTNFPTLMTAEKIAAAMMAQ